MLTADQIKDLRLMREDELGAGRVFYVKDGDLYSTCKLSELEIFYFRPLAKQLVAQGRLFVRLNKPYFSFI